MLLDTILRKYDQARELRGKKTNCTYFHVKLDVLSNSSKRATKITELTKLKFSWRLPSFCLQKNYFQFFFLMSVIFFTSLFCVCEQQQQQQTEHMAGDTTTTGGRHRKYRTVHPIPAPYVVTAVLLPHKQPCSWFLFVRAPSIR